MRAFLEAIFLRPVLTGLIALRALRRNKLRSTLTALGIIIGVGSVVDLPNFSVVVGGLDRWERESGVTLHEDRVLAAVRQIVGPQLRELRTPPWMGIATMSPARRDNSRTQGSTPPWCSSTVAD